MSSVLESSSPNETSLNEAANPTPSLDSLPTDEFLKVVGMRVRAQRSAKSMSRKKLAEVSGVSERYLAQLESGQGNMSIALLRKVTTAINLTLANLLTAETPELHDPADAAENDACNNSDASIAKNGFNRENSVMSKSHMATGH